MEKIEIKELCNYLNRLSKTFLDKNHELGEAISFSFMEMNHFLKTGKKNSDFEEILKYAKSIPKFKNFESLEFKKWVDNNQISNNYYNRIVKNYYL